MSTIGRRNLKGNEAQYAVRYMSYMSESPERGETWSATGLDSVLSVARRSRRSSTGGWRRSPGGRTNDR